MWFILLSLPEGYSGWMRTIQNKIQGHFKDFEKKIQGHEKLID